MKLYKATDALDNTDSFFLVYPNGEVAVMLEGGSVENIRAKTLKFERTPADRFDDAVNPVLVAEWE